MNSKGKQLAPDRLTLLEKFMFFLCFTAFVSIVYVALRFLAVEESPSKVQCMPAFSQPCWPLRSFFST